MKHKAKIILTHPLITGSTVIFVGAMISNIFQFLFNLFMSRSLSVSEYGILASVFSVITLITLLPGSIAPTVMRFAGTYFSNEDYDKVRGLFFKMFRISFFFGISAFLLLFLFSGNISKFFKVDDPSIIVISGIIVFLYFLYVINQGLIQAKLSFKFLSVIAIISSFSKFILGVIFILMGMRVIGGVWSILLSYLILYIISFAPLRFLFKKNTVMPSLKLNSLFSYGLPAAVTTFGLTSLITTDIILVKHYFDPVQAGYYAGLSLIGRVIFFFSSPISTVMFPLVVKQFTRGEKYENTFKLSLLLVFLFSIGLTLFYAIFPEFIIKLFLRNESYLAIKPNLVIFGIFITLYSLLSVFVNYYLSIKKTGIYIPIISGAVLQVILIVIYHDNLPQVILLSLFVTSLLLLYFLVDYIKLRAVNDKE